MKNEYNIDNNKTYSKIDFAKETATLLLRQKLLFNHKDHFSIILIGTDDQSVPKYDNVAFIKYLEKPEISTFEIINSIEASNTNKGDCKIIKILLS